MGGILGVIARDLKQVFDAALVDELLASYVEAKRNFYLGGLRLSEVEGGRFCEAAFRLLQMSATGTFTPLGQQIDSDKTIALVAQATALPDSIRLHIPRSLRVVYDIRNKRDAAHLGDGIDPNVQDASLVAAILDWVMAEFVRVYHKVPPEEAHQIIDDLVARRAPAIEDYDGFLKVLKPDLKVRQYLLLILYERGSQGATFAELSEWAKPTMRKNLKRALDQLVNDLALAHFDTIKYRVTRLGIQEVEKTKLHAA